MNLNIHEKEINACQVTPPATPHFNSFRPFLVMKLTVFLITVISLQVTASVFSQEVSLSAKDAPLEIILKKISKQTGYEFFYKSNFLSSARAVTINVHKIQLKDALEKCFANQPFTYDVIDKVILIKNKEEISRTRAVSWVLSGTVTDEEGEPLPSASVKIKRTNKAVLTDILGKFMLEVQDEDDSIQVSFIGFTTQSIRIGNNRTINVRLLPDEAQRKLNEVVIVGYGTQKKQSSVGSQSSIEPSVLKGPVRDLTTVLAGRISGIVATQRGAAPGSETSSLFVRGISTFASSPQGPLLVVDGVPDRAINNLDPEDIANFTVLKDATATAVYGTRGANGVILITTKRGKVGKPVINAEINQGVSKFTALPEFINGPDFMTLYNKGLTMRGRSPLYTEERIEKHRSGVDQDLYPDVNWYDVLFSDFGQNSRATLNVNGGSENANYYISAGYFGESGQFKTDDIEAYNSSLKLDRFNFTNNINVNLTNTTKLDLGINGFLSNVNGPAYGVNELFSLATSSSPHVIPPRYSNGQWPQLPGTQISPLMALTQSGVTNGQYTTVRSNIRGTQDLKMLLKGLSVTGLFAFDVNMSRSLTRARTLQTYYASGRDAQNRLVTGIAERGNDALQFGISRFVDRRLYSEAGINYNRNFGLHDVSGLLLVNQSDFSDANAGSYTAAIPYRQRNFVGRLTYGFNSKYLAEANFSYSGSDNFIESKRYGFFPSFGAGWVLSNEKFFEPISPYLTFFKLRYSYGLSGNAAVNSPENRFLYLTTLGDQGGYVFGDPGSTTWYTGLGETRIGGDVHWETSYRQNLGVEATFFRNIQLVVELFKENREGILMPNYVIPYSSGFTIGNIPFNNIGKTKNKGIDITLDYNKNWTNSNFISFRGVFNYNKNLAVYDGLPPYNYPYLNRVGKPISQRFGYIATGLFENEDEIEKAALQSGDVRPGDIRYKDLNGDGIINGNDETGIGYGSVPRIVYGLSLGGGFKGFDMSLFFQGVGMVDFNYSGGYATTPFSNGPTYGNMYTMILDHWTPGTPNVRPFYPRLSTNQDVTTNYYTSTWWIKRADYLRLKQAEIGYTFSNNAFFEKGHIKKIRMFLNGTNLFTLSPWKFWDPELGDGRGAAYPNITAYNLGVRVNFQ
ncbi:TonB-dependent receptor [Desertivirga xinjiangensis]|uniref:TonB-dependent receptor n=1 Tax=Desertivirga xinjiangensis TaxID=539206 RepID=UPI00210A8FC9|nr:TonB-dependent receptor [Pedobacter xinjiangensis]